MNELHQSHATEVVRVWTVQPVEVYHSLVEKTTLTCDPKLALSSNFAALASQYSWMADQMTIRIPGYSGGLPWWAHFSPRPSIRKLVRTDPAGLQCVRIALEMPKDRVLLSAINAWLMVTYHDYVAYEPGEYENWYSEKGLDPDCDPRALPMSLRSEISSTWPRIFEIEKLRTGGEFSVDRVQATFEALDLSSVRRVDHFETVGARYCVGGLSETLS